MILISGEAKVITRICSSIKSYRNSKVAAFVVTLGALALPTSAHATGELTCRTAGDRTIEISVGFGHVPNASAISAALRDNKIEIPVRATQWWMRGSELRIALMSASDDLTEEAIIMASYNKSTGSFDGSIWRSGKRRWIRCYGN